MENRYLINKYSEQYYPPSPTSATLFWRSFIPFQIIRFMVLTWRIVKIVVKGHS